MGRVRNVVLGMLLLCALVPSLAVAAEDEEDFRTTVEALKQRLRDQDRRIAELEARQATSGPTTVESQKEQIKQVVREMKADTKEGLTTPSWLEGLKFAGDLRLRYEYNGFNWGSMADSEKKDRHRARYRLRVRGDQDLAGGPA